MLALFNKHRKLITAMLAGCLFGVVSTVVVGELNGVPTCSVFDACGSEESIVEKIDRLEKKLDKSVADAIAQNEKAMEVANELEGYKERFRGLHKDIGEVNSNLRRLIEGEGDDYEKIKKETAFIRAAMRRINVYLGLDGGS